ncbi:MAG: hypothetical protein FWD24_00790 [Treponema sp.]|nr:hypothetical protein [Treponema sp.]
MKNCKILSFCIIILALAAGPAFSQMESLDELKNTTESFAKAMAQALPFNSTIGLNWSDAYIGQLLDTPPRFGFGISAGATIIKLDLINKMIGELGGDQIPDILMGLPLPGYTIDARIGGFILPFDIGIKVGVLDTSKMGFDLPVGIEYFLFGFDFRYALVDSKVMPIKVSVGAGFNHLSGGINMDVPLGE